MNVASLPASVLAELARTSPAPAGLTLLRSALHTRRLLLLKALLVRVHRERASVGTGALGRFERSWDLLEQVERHRPAVVRDVLDYPTTGVWLAAALAEPAGPGFDRLLNRLDMVALTAALRCGDPLDLTVETADGLLSLPGVGRLRLPSDRVRIIAGNRTVRFHPDAGRTPRPPSSPSSTGAGACSPDAGPTGAPCVRCPVAPRVWTTSTRTGCRWARPAAPSARPPATSTPTTPPGPPAGARPRSCSRVPTRAGPSRSPARSVSSSRSSRAGRATAVPP